MKTIGLIGGMSWESTVSYYQIINRKVKSKLGGLHSAKCVIYSIDFGEIEVLQQNQEWNKVGENLGLAAKNLELAGADLIIICSNTTHKVAKQIQDNIGIPLLHVADMTGDRISSKKIGTVGLLGTLYTMNQTFFKSRLEEKGIRVIVPDKGDKDIINNIIFQELCRGVVNPGSKEKFKIIIKKLVKQGAKGIILGCTEIGLLIDGGDSEVPLFDTTKIHAEGAVDYAFER